MAWREAQRSTWLSPTSRAKCRCSPAAQGRRHSPALCRLAVCCRPRTHRACVVVDGMAPGDAGALRACGVRIDAGGGSALLLTARQSATRAWLLRQRAATRRVESQRRHAGGYSGHLSLGYQTSTLCTFTMTAACICDGAQTGQRTAPTSTLALCLATWAISNRCRRRRSTRLPGCRAWLIAEEPVPSGTAAVATQQRRPPAAQSALRRRWRPASTASAAAAAARQPLGRQCLRKTVGWRQPGDAPRQAVNRRRGPARPPIPCSYGRRTQRRRTAPGDAALERQQVRATIILALCRASAAPGYESLSTVWAIGRVIGDTARATAETERHLDGNGARGCGKAQE